jgi:hypothetical protein
MVIAGVKVWVVQVFNRRKHEITTRLFESKQGRDNYTKRIRVSTKVYFCVFQRTVKE